MIQKLPVEPKVPVAIIGGGSIAPFHAKYVQRSSTCELIAIIDPFQSGQDLAVTLGVAHFRTVQELVSCLTIERKPDLYIICVPSSLHVRLATEVLEAILAEPSPLSVTAVTSTDVNANAKTKTKVILVEKPFATDSRSGEQLMALAAASSPGRCQLAVGHHRRFHRAAVAARKTITAGKIGDVLAVSGMWAAKKNDGYFDVEWRRSRKGGGGPVWTNFVHDVDLLHYLVGSNITTVWATTTKTTRTRRIQPENIDEEDKHELAEVEVDVEEGAAIMMRFANGVVGTFILSDAAPGPYFWEAATGENPLMPRASNAVDVYRLFGTKGTLTVPDGNLWSYHDDGDDKEGEAGWNAHLKHEKAKTVAVDVNEEDVPPFQAQIEHLVRVVKGEEEKVNCSGGDGLMAVKVCEAVVQALDSKDDLPRDIK